MIKMVFLVRRRPGMDVETFQRSWREHSSLSASLPGVRKYVQNHATAAQDGTPPAYDGFAEMWWDDVAAYERAVASPEMRTVAADLERFIDVQRMHAFSVDEVTIV